MYKDEINCARKCIFTSDVTQAIQIRSVIPKLLHDCIFKLFYIYFTLSIHKDRYLLYIPNIQAQFDNLCSFNFV